MARARAGEGDKVQDEGTGRQFALALGVALAATAAAVGASGPLPRHPARWWTGIALIWSGAALNRVARHELGSAYRPQLTVVADHQVATSGPYRFVRHPMYTGSTLICLGAALAVDHRLASSSWAAPVAALVRRIGVEEQLLERELGDAYAAYARGRARLVPGLW